MESLFLTSPSCSLRRSGTPETERNRPPAPGNLHFHPDAREHSARTRGVTFDRGLSSPCTAAVLSSVRGILSPCKITIIAGLADHGADTHGELRQDVFCGVCVALACLCGQSGFLA